MRSQRKNKAIILKRSDFEIFCLIKEGLLGACTHLMSKKEVDVLKNNHNNLEGCFYPYVLSYCASQNALRYIEIGDSVDLICDKKVVGALTISDKFKDNSCMESIFSSQSCDIGERVFLGGEFELFSSHIKHKKEEFLKLKKDLNAQVITALVMSLDPLHRGHEHILRWSIDKADLVVIFLIESYEPSGFDFELKLAYTKEFINKYIPKERVFIFELKNIDIFHAHLNPMLEASIASALGCTKLVVGQTHTGLGTYYDANRPYTMLDDCMKEYSLQVIVLPELVYCEECTALVSTKSCPHGAHHHLKFNARALKQLLKLGIIPPPVFMRREISISILEKLFPKRFESLKNLYNELFTTYGIIEEKSDKEFYEELLRIYELKYIV